MKKILILLCCLGLVCCAETNHTGYTINGKLVGAEDNALILLTVEQNIIDSTRVNKGKFTLKGSVEEPMDARLRLDGIDYTGIWVENSEIHFSAEVGKFDQAVITGSQSQLEEDALQKKLKPFDDIQDQVDEAFDAKGLTQKQTDSLNRAYKKAEQDYFDVMIQYIKENPNSLVGLDYLDFYKTSVFNKSDVQTAYEALSESLQNHPQGKSIARYLSKSEVNLGDTFVDITLQNTEDQELVLSQNLGEYTLVQFWTSSCSFCRASNLKLVKIYEEFQPKGFQIFGVSFDQKKEKWLKAIEKDGLTWNNVVDLSGENGDVALQYGVSAFPDNLLLDKEGKVIARDISTKNLAIKLQEILN
jgi:peroxiredoxin